MKVCFEQNRPFSYPDVIFAQKGNFDFEQWRPKHGPEHTRPHLDKVINALKEQGVKSFAAVGYCFGGKH